MQWGVLSDGNRYVLYNSLGGISFEDQKFLTLEIKTVDTDSGFTMDEFVKRLTTLLSRECLENEEIQQAYEEHTINSRIRLALDSYTVDDPETYARPWTATIPMTRFEGPIFEYACHERNYGMEGILSGARAEERGPTSR